MQKRSEHAEELNDIILSRLVDYSKKEVYDKLQQHKVSTAYLANVEDLFQSEQYQAHDYFVSHSIIRSPGRSLIQGLSRRWVMWSGRMGGRLFLENTTPKFFAMGLDIAGRIWFV